MPDETQKPAPLEVPAGMMRVWDPEGKKIVLVPVPPNRPERITLTIRVHDAKEKNDPAKSAEWVSINVERSAVGGSLDDFIAQVMKPALAQFAILSLK